MSVGIGTQFAASLAPDQTQTWFTYGWDPNHFLIWSILPTNSPDQVRPERVQIAYEATGVTHFLTIANTGPWPASSEANYYFKTIIPEGEWRNLGPPHISGCITRRVRDYSSAKPLPHVSGLDAEARHQQEEDNVKQCLACSRETLGQRTA